MLERLRPVYRAALRPVMLLCRALHIHPDAVTIAGVGLFCLAGYLTAVGRWHAALICVIAGSCLDGLDGLLAKETGRKTTFGAILDSSCDRLTEIAWFGGMIAYYLLDAARDPGHAGIGAAFAALAGSYMVSYVKARAEGMGVACDPGILQRPERLIAIMVCLLLGPRVMLWGLWVIAALSWVTVVQRFVVAWRGARTRDRSPGAR